MTLTSTSQNVTSVDTTICLKSSTLRKAIKDIEHKDFLVKENFLLKERITLLEEKNFFLDSNIFIREKKISLLNESIINYQKLDSINISTISLLKKQNKQYHTQAKIALIGTVGAVLILIFK